MKIEFAEAFEKNFGDNLYLDFWFTWMFDEEPLYIVSRWNLKPCQAVTVCSKHIYVYDPPTAFFQEFAK